MRDRELYERVLGLMEPWHVERVDLQVKDQRVDVWVNHPSGEKWPCAKCGQPLSCRDHAEERVWRHLDTCQFKTYLHARIPRVECPEHGVLNVSVPWAEARSRFTLMMECLIIDVLKQCATVTGTCDLLRINWDEAFGVMERAVARGQARKQEVPVGHLGVDEKAYRKGHSYMTVVCDLDQSTVEYVAEHRKAESLAGYFQSLTSKQLNGIEAVAMDMWDPYVKATLESVPLAKDKIVFDRFHIMKNMNTAVDTVRKQEHRTLKAQDDDTLKGTKYLWLYAYENIPDRRVDEFESIKEGKLKTARAWAIKEGLRDLWDYCSKGWARRYFKGWYAWAVRSRLQPIKKVARMLHDHLEMILNYCKHRITNGVAEGLNSKIMSIKRRACGYRNKENFKTSIYFFCGGLDLYPR